MAEQLHPDADRWCLDAACRVIDGLIVQSRRGLAGFGFEIDESELVFPVHISRGGFPKWDIDKDWNALYRRARRRHPVVGGYLNTLRYMLAARRSIDAGRFGEAMYFMIYAQPGFSGFFSQIGERSFDGGRTARKRKSVNQETKNTEMAREYLSLRDARAPDLPKFTVKQFGRERYPDLPERTIRDQIQKGRRALSGK